MSALGKNVHLFVMAAAVAALACAAVALCGCSTSMHASYNVTDGIVEADGTNLYVTLANDGPDDDHAWVAVLGGEGLGMKDKEEVTDVKIGESAQTSHATKFNFVGTSQGQQTVKFFYLLQGQQPSSADEPQVVVTATTDNKGNITTTETKASDGSAGSSKA